MQSLDSNILFPAVVDDHPDHRAAVGFLEAMQEREDVIISEFILVEVYVLLRNPAVMKTPASAPASAAICANWREHPKWRLAGFPHDADNVHDRLWARMSKPSFARRRVFDVRAALSLRYCGVTEFATVNLKHFQDLGFERVWDPLHPERNTPATH